MTASGMKSLNDLPKIPPVEDDIIEQAREAARKQTAEYAPGEQEDLTNQIKALFKKQNAVLVAHYYTSPELQQLAEETGGFVADSLEMARFGNEHPATTLVVAGVRFMGETAKILNPEKPAVDLKQVEPVKHCQSDVILNR